MNYDCPHCGKFTLRTFCEHCGKPTETLLKYRVLFSIGLIAIPAVTIWVWMEVQTLLPKLEPMYADLFPAFHLLSGFLAVISMGGIVLQWIEIESKFRHYYKNKKIVGGKIDG